MRRHSVTVPTKRRVGVGDLAGMNEEQLMRQSTDHLRRFASASGVKRASHMAGGKKQLVVAILHTRGA